MSGLPTHTLVGLVDPSGMSLGFLVPVFTYGLSNALQAQRLDENGRIIGFEPYGAPDAALLPAPIIGRRAGEPAVHAFAFGEGDVELATDDDLIGLASRVDDPTLAERPLLAMELADFLKLTDRRCEFAARAHAAMGKASQETADHWRDLSVLTPEVRRELALRSERSSRRLAMTVVARVHDRIVEIAGAGDQTSAKQLELIKRSTKAALSTLESLYPGPKRGWEIRLRRERKYAESSSREATLLIASTNMLKHRSSAGWPSPPDLEVFREDGPDFARVVEETRTPLFVAYDTDTPEQMHKAMGDWSVREMHGIGINASRRLPLDIDDQDWRTTYVSRGATISGVRLAIAAELDRKAADISWLPKSSVLLRTRGLTPDPNSDAWAALYDQAWALGLAPWSSLLIPGPDGRQVLSERDQDWAANILFEEPSFLQRRLARGVMEQIRATAALLVDAAPRSQEDNARHVRSVSHLLEQQGWEIRGRDVRDVYAEFSIEGARAHIEVRINSDNEVIGGPSVEDALTIDLRDLGHVVVTCAASTSAVLGHLSRTGDLVVDVRDLVRFDAREATKLSLLGAQLRRVVTRLPSRSRTILLAMLIMQAFRWGSAEAEGATELHQAINSSSLGDTLHLVVSSTRAEGSLTSAEVRLVATDDEAKPNSRWRELGRYRLVIAPDAITLHSI